MLWAGNNENEAALVQNWYGTNSNFKLYKDDYLKLYRETIQKVVAEEDSSRPFVLSSPSNGVIQTENAGGVNDNPGNMLFGDVHVYNYYVDGWDPSSYPQGPRFASEYGWQSFPRYNSDQLVFTCKLHLKYLVYILALKFKLQMHVCRVN